MGRSVYRADELITFNGVSGGAYANQPLFIGMDATLMVCLDNIPADGVWVDFANDSFSSC